MILFIAEGKKSEPLLLKTINTLFLKNKDENIIVSFNNNIYELYRQLNEMSDGADIVAVMKDKLLQENNFKDFNVSDIAEKYLFFDYDFQNKNIPLQTMNAELQEMLQFFDEETENGKLYINYPMIESIKYTKELPDKNYYKYLISRDVCKDFKNISAEFSFYKSWDFITLPQRRSATEKETDKIRNSWKLLTEQNVKKANFICNGDYLLPESKDTINQYNIFDNQLQKYIKDNQVSVLNSLPLFLYDYISLISED